MCAPCLRLCVVVAVVCVCLCVVCVPLFSSPLHTGNISVVPAIVPQQTCYLDPSSPPGFNIYANYNCTESGTIRYDQYFLSNCTERVSSGLPNPFPNDTCIYSNPGESQRRFRCSEDLRTLEIDTFSSACT